MAPNIIGLAGRSGAGKDEGADYLCRQFGFRKGSVANPIRKEWEQFVVRALLEAAKREDLPESLDVVVKAYADAVWNKPTSPEQRVGLQWWGTEYRRNQDPDYWTPELRRMLQTAQLIGENVVIPDIRIPLEVSIVREFGGQVWWVNRKTKSNVGLKGHATENSLSAKDCDRVVDNVAGIEHYYAILDAIYQGKPLPCPTKQYTKLLRSLGPSLIEAKTMATSLILSISNRLNLS